MVRALIDTKTIDETVKETEPIHRIAAKTGYRHISRNSWQYSGSEKYDPTDTAARQRMSTGRYESQVPVIMPTETAEKSAHNTQIIIKPREMQHENNESYKQKEHDLDPLPPAQAIEVCQEMKTEAVFRSGRKTHPDTKERLTNWLRADQLSAVYLKLAESLGIRTRDYSIDLASLN